MKSVPIIDHSSLRLTNGTTKILDYRFRYSRIEAELECKFTTLFPRTGYLILSFLTGGNMETRFLNYDRTVSRPNQIYISGLYTGSSVWVEHRGRGSGYAMKIHPVIGYHLLGSPLSQLTDRQVRLCDVLERHGRLLEAIETDYEIDSFDHPRLRQFFADVLPVKAAYQNDPIYHAVNEIASGHGVIRVKNLARKCFMCERTFYRQFMLKVGISPRAYAKIWQLNYAMELIRKNPGAILAQIAFEAGYHDVAHLARDFRDRVSLRPSQFLAGLNPLSQQYLGAVTSLV